MPLVCDDVASPVKLLATLASHKRFDESRLEPNWPSYLHNKCTNPLCSFPNPPQAAKGKYQCSGQYRKKKCPGVYYVSHETVALVMKQHRAAMNKEQEEREAKWERELWFGKPSDFPAFPPEALLPENYIPLDQLKRELLFPPRPPLGTTPAKAATPAKATTSSAAPSSSATKEDSQPPPVPPKSPRSNALRLKHSANVPQSAQKASTPRDHRNESAPPPSSSSNARDVKASGDGGRTRSSSSAGREHKSSADRTHHQSSSAGRERKASDVREYKSSTDRTRERKPSDVRDHKSSVDRPRYQPTSAGHKYKSTTNGTHDRKPSDVREHKFSSNRRHDEPSSGDRERKVSTTDRSRANHSSGSREVRASTERSRANPSSGSREVKASTERSRSKPSSREHERNASASRNQVANTDFGPYYTGPRDSLTSSIGMDMTGVRQYPHWYVDNSNGGKPYTGPGAYIHKPKSKEPVDWSGEYVEPTVQIAVELLRPGYGIDSDDERAQPKPAKKRLRLPKLSKITSRN